MNEPAFPCIAQDGTYMQPGMTMRDYFAAKAMQGFINNAPSGTKFGTNQQEVNLNYALASYAMADAMMKARES